VLNWVSKVKEKFGGVNSSILSGAVGQLFLLLDSLIVPCFSFLSSWLEEEVACNGGSWLES